MFKVDSFAVQYYYSPSGKSFRSKKAVARALKPTVERHIKVEGISGCDAPQAGSASGQDLPFKLPNDVTVTRYRTCLKVLRCVR